MTSATRWAMVAAIPLMAVASACSSGGEGSEASDTAAAATGRPLGGTVETSSASSQSDSDVDAAIEAVQAYVERRDALTAVPRADAADALAEIVAVAMPDGLAAIEAALSSAEYAERGWRTVGSTRLFGAFPVSPDDTVDSVDPTVDLALCADVSGIDAVDATGASVVPDGRPPLFAVRAVVAQRDGAWRVASYDIEGESDHVPTEEDPCGR